MDLSLISPARANVPDWLAVAVIGLSVLLAILTIVFTFLRVRPSSDEAGLDDTHGQTRYFDPVLFISALSVILLAVAAWLLR